MPPDPAALQQPRSEETLTPDERIGRLHDDADANLAGYGRERPVGFDAPRKAIECSCNVLALP